MATKQTTTTISSTAIQSCTDKCSTAGKIVCLGGTLYLTCGNYDADPCLKLSNLRECPNGEICKSLDNGEDGCAAVTKSTSSSTSATPSVVPIGPSGIGAYYEIYSDKIIIKWTNPSLGAYYIDIKTADSSARNIYIALNKVESVSLNFNELRLKGDEILIGQFKEIIDGFVVDEYPTFEIDLSGKNPPRELEKPSQKQKDGQKPQPVTKRWTNPTAPNGLVKYLSGDFTDTDGDGMTDVAETKYGFNLNDPSSFPAEPELVENKLPIESSEIGAYYEVYRGKIIIKWSESPDVDYSLHLKTSDSSSWNIYYGGHYIDSAEVNFNKFNLKGNEKLVGSFGKSDKDGNFVEQYSEFEIDLSHVKFPQISDIGAPDNRISYTFSSDFPEDAESKYREFLKRVLPIMYSYLGPPAESINVLIKNMGEDTDYFMIVDNGRTFLSDTDFIPRLIVHELVHAWKGGYTITSDKNWEYDKALSGFEEGGAEGLAFEIIHEYVRDYPNDVATKQLLSYKPFQYWSKSTTYYDSLKNLRWTGAGQFWTDNDAAYIRYSISATTIQMMIKENPDFMKQFLSMYYKRIRENPDWRPNRGDIIDMWAALVPALNGYPLKEYLNTIPVFNGRNLDRGIYALTEIRPYGAIGDQQFAVSYAAPNGRLWDIEENDIKKIPKWVKVVKGSDGYYYMDFQDSIFMVEVANAHGQQTIYSFKTIWKRHPNGLPTGYGWVGPEELNMENFPIGLYKETVTFTDYLPYDSEASDTFYFFGLKGFSQNRANEYVIMIGVDGVPSGTAEIYIDGVKYTAPIINGAAVFTSTEWKFDMQGRVLITITNADGISKTYYRTIVESGTYHLYYQQQFIIVDIGFNGIEDQFE